MERLIALLREKNLFLEKFFAMNENELINFAEGNFESVEGFYKARDKVLELIACIDGLIEEESKTCSTPVAHDDRHEVERLLRVKDEWVTSILAQDLQVLSYIEKEKSNIIRELQTAQKARKAIGAYGSTERSRQLDEKA